MRKIGTSCEKLLECFEFDLKGLRSSVAVCTVEAGHTVLSEANNYVNEFFQTLQGGFPLRFILLC